MAQPPIPLDTKTPPPPPAMPPGPVPASLPPSYPSTIPPYPQPQGLGVQRPFAGQPLQQPLYSGLPPQQIPPGARPPLGTFSPQSTGYASPGQQVPITTIPPHQVHMGALPQQPLGPSPAQQMPMMNVPMMQAQLGAQFQATQYAQCAMGNHARQAKYGVLGIIGAILFFPIGLLCLFADRHDVCLRCGQRL